MRKLLETRPDLAGLVARLGLGIFILPHGLQKAFGWFGGHGIEGTVAFMGAQLHIPAALAFLAIAAEFLGGLGLLLGFLTRIAAFGVTVTLFVAAIMVHGKIGFFSGQAGTGWEMHLLGVVLGLVLMIRGGGLASVDDWLSRRGGREEAPIQDPAGPAASSRIDP